jgi:uncharacterized protein YukE
MNQVMINAVDLEMLVQEIKDLKVKIAELNKMLADERGRNKVPEREWVGLTKDDFYKKLDSYDTDDPFVLGMIRSRNY